ncbi:MAG TPA: MBL fold metallo-hydrolase [Nonomuraea sp.]|nr:MBL fold metallo-hydrolase [Nonomuraea sp.]
MIFEALPARFGDCLLLRVPGAGGTKLMVIDGGPGTVFKDTLAPRLQMLAPSGQPLTIDALMVSHVDADHITGVLALLSAVQKAKIGNTKPPYKVRQLMFNSFDRLAQAVPAEVSGGAGVLKSLGASSILLGEHATQEVLASVAQGSDLATLAAALKVPLNPSAKGDLLFVGAKPKPFAFGEADVLVVGPRKTELDELRKEWAAWRAKKDKEALKALAAYADKSVPNLSSIVAVVTWKGKRILLTGDARGDYVLEGLELAGLLKKGGRLDKPLDVLKLPHHGSDRNVDNDFFERLPAHHYVASGDGWFGNPDPGALEMIEKARPDGKYTLHLTYSADHMDQEHAKYLAQQKKPKAFDPKKHSVKPVLSRLDKAGVAVRFGPARIDLAQD